MMFVQSNSSLSRRFWVVTPLVLTVGTIILSSRGMVVSVPRFSAEQGLTCGECHFAPTGGAMRNEYGHFTMSVNELTLEATKKKVLASYKGPRLSESAMIGADIRWKGTTDGSFQRYQTNFYFSYEPLSHSYFNLNFTSGGIDESYFLLGNTNNSVYAQFGRMYPAFGIRYEDPNAHVRLRSGYPHGKSVDGLSLGARALGHEFQLTAYAGQQGQNVGLVNVARYAWIGPLSYMYGASWSQSERVKGYYGSNLPAKAAYAGVGWKGHSAMYEFDLVGEVDQTYAMLAAVTAKFAHGVWAHVDYNFLEPDRRYTSGIDEFFRFALEVWPMPFVELSPTLIAHTEGPRHGERDYEFLAHVAF